MAFSFRNEVVAFLKENENIGFTAREIAEHIASEFPKACDEKINKSKNNELKTRQDCINQWMAEIGSYKENFMKKGISYTATRPRKYYYLNKNQKETSEEQKKNELREKKLYPKLAEFCESINIKTLRIDEHTSTNKVGENYNKWLHADVVGFEDLIADFNDYAKECLIEYGDIRSNLYSFEVKAGTVETYNLRKDFFQAVSNSSWANYSYFVAEDVNQNAMDELQLLCSSFRIGFIQLNAKKPADSQIVIHAPKTPLDWKMINRIASVNKDFRKYLENIILAYQGHSNPKTQKPSWDL